LCNKNVNTVPEIVKNKGAVSPLKNPHILNAILPDEPVCLTWSMKKG